MSCEVVLTPMTPVEEEEDLEVQFRRLRTCTCNGGRPRGEDYRLRHSMIEFDYSKRHSDPLLEGYYILEQVCSCSVYPGTEDAG